MRVVQILPSAPRGRGGGVGFLAVGARGDWGGGAREEGGVGGGGGFACVHGHGHGGG